MAEADQATTAFITPYGPFCFNTMPFGLKNAGTTYQRMIQTCLANQIGKTVEAYTTGIIYFAICHGGRQRHEWRTTKVFAIRRGRQTWTAK